MYVLISGQLHREPQAPQSKAGKQFVTRRVAEIRHAN
jgi:hypothetical protein